MRRYYRQMAFAQLPVVMMGELEINWRLNDWHVLQKSATTFAYPGLSFYDIVMLLFAGVWLGALVLFCFNKVDGFYRCRVALAGMMIGALMWSANLYPSGLATMATHNHLLWMFFPLVIPDQWEILAMLLSLLKWIPLQLTLESIVQMIRLKRSRSKQNV